MNDLTALPLMLGDAANPPLEMFPIAMGLVGGLALFLLGLDQMSGSLKLIAGEGMRTLLARLTGNRFSGLLAGAVVTSIVQSSSITTVLLIGFISAGLMSLVQSIGVIMGANIGTTVTTQLIAFQVTSYSLLFVATGFFLWFAVTNERIKYLGQLIMGLGLIFFGMQLMSDATAPLRDYQPFIFWMRELESPLYAILLAALLTALLQSSSATTGLVITLAAGGFLSLDSGIALIFGANVGTCVTAALASLGKPREAVRAALVHVIFNVAGVVIWYGLIPQLADLVSAISPTYPGLAGVERLAAETPRQIANAHTLFNIANALVFIWFVTPMAWLVERLVPDRAEPQIETVRPKYLDPALLQTPSLALEVVQKELGRLGAAALRMMRGAFDAVVRGTSVDIARLEAMDDSLDALHAAIVVYLGQLSQQSLSDKQSSKIRDYLAAANYIESIGDMIETNLAAAARQRLQDDLRISAATEDVLRELNDAVVAATLRAIRALVSDDASLAAKVPEAKAAINRLEEIAQRHLADRLSAKEPKRLATYRLESELMEYLKRMYYFSKRIAKLISESLPEDSSPPQSPDAG